MPIRRLEDTLTATTATVEANDLASTALASVEHVKPHIQPGVLYPAIAGKGIDGSTTVTSFGTDFAISGYPTLKYYYTDIKGSKPIKDPRIGAHFGSQRYIISSIQSLEQETGIHGSRVYSVDGREWMRLSASANNSLTGVDASVHGVRLALRDNDYIEVVGYFNAANLSKYAHSAYDTFTAQIDGGTAQTTDNTITQNSPLRNRCVSAGSFFRIPFHSSASMTTAGLHTLRIEATSETYWYAIELIAQDTTSTATKSKIQIPAQNVVSYGKKFALTAAAHHYDPFNGFTNSSHLHSTYVDTATSLGLSTAPGSSASWAISSTNNIRPYNGGRVVKWVDSSGTIKTSVNMIPPNAQNIGNNNAQGSAGIAAAEIATPSATNVYLPAFSDDVIDNSQTEISRSFKVVEFGNGHANGNFSWRDWTFDSSSQGSNVDRSYIMDDGLTTLAGRCRGAYNGMYPDDTNDSWFLTFIGTGITIEGSTGTRVLAQNLPYGTHIVKMTRAATTTQSQWTVDSINVSQRWGSTNNNEDHMHSVSFHQPKLPPIPDDACIIADYMLMADYVAQTAAGATKISKGVRRCSGTRDVYYDSSATFGANVELNYVDGGEWGYYSIDTHSSTVATCTLPYFGTTAIGFGQAQPQSGFSAMQHSISGAAYATSAVTKLDNGDATYADPVIITTAMTLGYNGIKHTMGGGGYKFVGFDVVSPIHSSSHYQTFEGPYQKELVGGDRNMEQTNLIVTADGKTWDELRDTSYIGSLKVRASHNHHYTGESQVHVFDEWRGYTDSIYTLLNKDFAIAYDKVVCLVSGEYQIQTHQIANQQDLRIATIRINGTTVLESYTYHATGNNAHNTMVTMQLTRGDYVEILGPGSDYNEWCTLEIIRT